MCNIKFLNYQQTIKDSMFVNYSKKCIQLIISAIFENRSML